MHRSLHPPPLYAIADAEAVAPRAVGEAVEELGSAGVRWIQVRAKHMEDRLLYEELEKSCRLAARLGFDLWIDDRADLAALLPVAGVHVGQEDLPPEAVREIVGNSVWIGRSTHNEEQFRRADADPDVDVIALGPIFATTGKRDPDPVVGLGLLRRLAPSTTKPVIAIGGVEAGRIASVLEAGADCAAVLGAVCHGDLSEQSRRLLALVRESA